MGYYHCCICIPIRAGVLIIALLTAAVYIAATVLQFISGPTAGANYTNGSLSLDAIKGIHYALIAVNIIVALASLFGVLGCITQHRKMIAIFRIAFWTVTIIEFIAFIASIIIFALGRSSFIDYCVASPVEPSYTYETCSAYYRNFMIVYSIVVVIVNFIQFYFATVISAYSTRLRKTNMHEKLRNLEDFPEPPNKTEFF